MKKILMSSVMAIGLLTLILSPTNANAAAGFVYKSFVCPNNGLIVLPAGGRVEVEDVIVSTNGNTSVALKFMPGGNRFMKVYMKANTTVVSNFRGQVESTDEQSIQLDCDGEANVTVTIVGAEAF